MESENLTQQKSFNINKIIGEQLNNGDDGSSINEVINSESATNSPTFSNQNDDSAESIL